jgi:hypothetical protein
MSDPVVHRTRQEPPWPPSPEATYMLTRWVCRDCGWLTPVVKDQRGNSALEEMRAQAARHEQNPEETP